jgi:hypothetical protein
LNVYQTELTGTTLRIYGWDLYFFY